MITNELNLPKPFVDVVSKEYEYKTNQYSVTAMLKGTTQILLERRHHKEIEQDVSDMIWMIFGTAVHSILENGKEEVNQLKENKIVIDHGEYKLSGIFDLYDDDTKTVTDYKTGTVWKIQFNEWEDYRKQLLMYAYMLRTIGFECNAGEIVLILKDHSKSKAKFDSSYPQKPVYIKHFDFKDDDFKEIKEYIKDKFDDIKQHENIPDDKLKPCSEEERWHKEDKWAIMKKGRKSAIKLHDNELSAKEHLNTLDNNHYIELREGTDTNCTDYCKVKNYCPFYKNKYGNNQE